MSNVGLAIFLFAIVVAVIVATRPTPPRRRRMRSSRPPGEKPGPNRTRPVAMFRRGSVASSSFDQIHRNRWDRADIAAAIGRDHESPDIGLTIWPASK